MAYVQNCLRGKTFLALEVSTTSQNSTKKILFRLTNKWVKREASQSWNEVCPLKLIQAWPMACHDHKSKLKRRCALHKCSYMWRAPAVEFWTLQIALSSSGEKRIIQPDKIKTLAHGFRGWDALGIRGGLAKGDTRGRRKLAKVKEPPGKGKGRMEKYRLCLF